VLHNRDGIKDLLKCLIVECAPSKSKQDMSKALFNSQKILQNFLDSSSHQIFRRMHEVLNIDENKN